MRTKSEGEERVLGIGSGRRQISTRSSECQEDSLEVLHHQIQDSAKDLGVKEPVPSQVDDIAPDLLRRVLRFVFERRTDSDAA
jgi:hypothetical protein